MIDPSTGKLESTTGPIAASVALGTPKLDAPADTPEPGTTPRFEDSRLATPGGDRSQTRMLPEIPGYELLREIGRGGMGVVYLARQRELKRLVALKMIRTDGPPDADQVERFRIEAEAVAQLRDPHIVQIYAIDKLDDQPFCALEYVEGENLAQRLAGTPQPPREAAQLVQTLARAMQTAHQQGIVHRDLKPANVLLTSDGQPKITDFGLAKLLGAPSGQTQTGAILGTPSYMAPEQAAGQKVGPAADIYALGAILYEALTGRPPFRGATLLDTLEQVRSREPVPPAQLQPRLPADLETICLKCLQKEPSRRYSSAAALAEDLESYLSGAPILARPIGGVERLWRWCRRNPRLAASLAAIILVFLLGSGGTAFFLSRSLSEAHRREVESHQAAAHIAKEKGAWRDVLRFYDAALAAGSPDTLRLRLDRLRALNAIGDRAQVDREVTALLARSDAAEAQGELLLWKAENDLFRNANTSQVVATFTAALAHPLPEADRHYAEAMRCDSAPAAVPLLRRALEADRHHQQARAVLALLLLSLGRFDEGREEATVGAVLFPDDQNFRLALALIHAFQGNRTAALAEVERSREQFGSDWAERVQASLLIILENVQELGAPIAGPIGDTTAEDRLIEAIVKLQPGAGAPATLSTMPTVILPFPPPLAGVAENIKAAFPAVMQNNVKDADRELRQACRRHPEGLLLNLYGQFLITEDRHAEAEKLFVEATTTPALLPVKRRSHYMAAMACQLQFDALDARGSGADVTGAKEEVSQRGARHVRALLAFGPLKVDEFYNCTLLSMRAKDYRLARQIIADWHDDKDWRRPWLEAELCLREAAFEQAFKAAQKTLEMKPGHPRSKEIQQLARTGLDKQLKELPSP